MAAANRLVLTNTTPGGKAVRIVILVAAAIIDPSGAAVTALRAALVAITNLFTNGASITAPGSYSSTSASGVYEDDQDKASMTFIDSVGKYHSFRVPGPKATIFQSGTDLVDLTNAGVIAYAGYITENFVAPTGAALVSLVRGRRIRLKAGGRS